MASRYACGPVKALPFGECVRLYVRVPAPKVNPSPPSAPRRVAPPAGEPPAPLPDDMPLPDFCNFGVVLRVLAVVNAVAVLGALAGAQTLIDAAQRFVSASQFRPLLTLPSAGTRPALTGYRQCHCGQPDFPCAPP